MPEAAERLFEELDFQRAVQVYLWALPAMNVDAMRRGSEAAFGAGNQVLPVWKDRLNTKTKVTTPNSDVVYAMSYLDLKAGPLVIDVPPQLQGMLDDFWHRPICDVGFVGPNKGQGGKYLLLLHDDDQREYAYQRGSEDALNLAADHGWQIISMQSDFRRVF